jgi:hypothetical protein
MLHINRCFFLFMLMLFFADRAQAEVRFGPFSWAPDEKSLVVVSPAPERAGVFIGYDAQSENAQQLSLSRFFKGLGLSLFLAFDTKRHQFTEIIFGNGKRYPIMGGVTLRIGSLRVGINAVTGHTQEAYWSISVESKEKPRIAGYSGLRDLFSYSGATALSYLEANQILSKEWSSSVHEYVVKDKHELFVGGQPFKGDVLGVTLPISNPCLDSEVQLQTTGPDASIGSIADFLVISLSESVLQVFRPADGMFGVIRASGEKGKETCTFVQVPNS